MPIKKRYLVFAGLLPVALAAVLTVQALEGLQTPPRAAYTQEELENLRAELQFVLDEPQSEPTFWVLVRANVAEADLLDAEGLLLQHIVFSDGEAAVGALASGSYALRRDEQLVQFTVAANASIRDVTGDGYTDGEILYFQSS